MLQKHVLLTILIIGVIVVVGGLALIGKINVKPSSENPSGPTQEMGSVQTQPETSVGTTPSPTKPLATAQPSQAQKMSVTSPAGGEKWVIGQNHKITWSPESGFKGYIYLTDVTTKQVVGWINSETNPHDTSYAWTTNDLFLDRYNPSKKPLAVGKYIIGIGFESKQAPITSAPFEIIYSSQATVNTYNLNIQNFVISPSNITVKKGSLLKFTNNDSIASKLILSGYSPFIIASGAQFTFDTSILFPGPYQFYLEGYPTGMVSVTVQ